MLQYFSNSEAGSRCCNSIQGPVVMWKWLEAIESWVRRSMNILASAVGLSEARAATETGTSGARRAPVQGRQIETAQKLTLYNTLTKHRDIFKPLDEPGKNVTW